MKVYLIRHAEAFPVDTVGRDEYRPLTDKGRDDVIRLGETCNRLSIGFDQIWSSEVLRAQETADLLNQTITAAPGIVFKDALGMPGDFNGLRSDLRDAPADSRIALVGHMPFLGECLQYWVGGRAHPGIHVGKCSIVGLDSQGFNSGDMELKFLLSRKLTKTIAAAITT